MLDPFHDARLFFPARRTAWIGLRPQELSFPSNLSVAGIRIPYEVLPFSRRYIRKIFFNQSLIQIKGMENEEENEAIHID